MKFNYKIFLKLYLFSFLILLAWPAHALVITSIVAAIAYIGLVSVGFAVSAATAWIAIAIGATIAISVYGGIALSAAQGKAKLSTGTASSPTLASPVLQTQTNPDLPVPLLYGENKLAGNIIWQEVSGNTVKKIIGFGFGEIQGFSDVRADDQVVTGSIGSYSAYTGTGSQTIDSRVTGSTQSDKAQVVGGMKHIAYLALTLNMSDKVSQGANITAIVQGRKIRVYTNSTTYTTVYSNNPAWVVLDLLINYNGLGECISTDGDIDDSLIAKYIDMDTFIESADYCDVIPDGMTDKRFTFNSIFDSRYSIFDAIVEVKKCCRGGLFIKGNKLQFKIDKAEDVSKILTKDDIVPLSETFTSLSIDKIHDIFKVEYISPDHEWSKIQAQAELSTHKNRASKHFSQDIYGCKSFEQASRLAWYYANRQILSPYSGTFETGMIAHLFEVGQVITIPVEMLNLEALDVKITAITAGNNGKYKVEWFNYDEDLYDDNLSSEEPTVIVTDITNIYGYPETIENFHAKVFLNSILFTWDLLSNPDVTYEIREGISWEDSILIQQKILGSTASTELYGTGTKTYWIKAKSKYGIYSENATDDEITISGVFLRNNVVETDLINTGSVTLSDCKILKNKIKPEILSTAYWQDLSPEKWLNSGERYYADFVGRWNYSCEESSYFISDVVDLLAILESVWYLNYNFYNGEDIRNTIKFYWEYNNDNNFTNTWIEFSPGSYNCRYAKFKVVFSNPNNVSSILQNCYIIADVPDRTEFYNDLLISKDGLTVTFATHTQSKLASSFTVPPAVVITPEDSSKTLTPVWSDRTKDSVTIYLYDNNDTRVTGTVDMTCKGY